MSEKKKLIIVITVILAIILTIILGEVISSKKSHDVRSQAFNLYNQADINIIYLGRPTCGYCQMFTPVIDSLDEKFNIDYTYVNTDNLKNKDLLAILDLFGVDVSTFGTPYLVITQNGKKIAEQSGYTDEVGLFTLFQEYGLINQDESNPYLASDDDEIVASFNEVLNGETRRLVYIGRPNCTFCQQLQPSIDELSETYNIDYYYINTNELTSMQLATILNKLGKKTSTFGTPYLAIVQNGEKIAEQPGYVEKDVLFKFLEDNGLINTEV